MRYLIELLLGWLIGKRNRGEYYFMENEALREIERAISWFNPHADGLVSKCAVCGKHPVKFDFVISDELWQKVVPQKLSPDVICLNCFDELAGGIPESEWRIIYYTGRAGTVAFIPVAALPEAKEK